MIGRVLVDWMAEGGIVPQAAVQLESGNSHRAPANHSPADVSVPGRLSDAPKTQGETMTRRKIAAALTIRGWEPVGCLALLKRSGIQSAMLCLTSVDI